MCTLCTNLSTTLLVFFVGHNESKCVTTMKCWLTMKKREKQIKFSTFSCFTSHFVHLRDLKRPLATWLFQVQFARGFQRRKLFFLYLMWWSRVLCIKSVCILRIKMSSSFFVSFCTKLKRQRKSDQASQNVAVYRTLLYLFPFRSKVSLCVPFVAPFTKRLKKRVLTNRNRKSN